MPMKLSGLEKKNFQKERENTLKKNGDCFAIMEVKKCIFKCNLNKLLLFM